MMGLTRRQRDLLAFITREQAAGRVPSHAAAARALGVNRSRAFELRRTLDARLGRARIAAIVPRGPQGERLTFIAIEDAA